MEAEGERQQCGGELGANLLLAFVVVLLVVFRTGWWFKSPEQEEGEQGEKLLTSSH